MAFLNPAARNAHEASKALLARILNPETDDKFIAHIMSAWIEVEAWKREIRGIPRLSTVGYRDMVNLGKTRHKPTSTQHEAFIEATPTPQTPKESLSTETVPTPPTPEAQ